MIKVSIMGREKPSEKNEVVSVALTDYGFLSQSEISAIISKIAEVFSSHVPGDTEDLFYSVILGALDFHENKKENSIEIDYRPEEKDQ